MVFLFLCASERSDLAEGNDLHCQPDWIEKSPERHILGHICEVSMKEDLPLM